MEQVDALMQSGILSGIFPGAALQVVADGKTVLAKAYGVADLFSGRSVTLETRFDLASLTKPLATAMAVMALVDRGMLDLDQSVVSVFTGLSSSDKEGITIRQLLNHSSGLPPWRPFFMRLRHVPRRARLDTLHTFLIEEPLIYSAGHRSDYSDLGYMFLQWVVETVSGQPLDRFVSDEIYGPLGIEALYYKDVTGAVEQRHLYAATQLCPWRGALMAGQVDDDNAWAVGGVAGHAGLFGTVGAVCRLLKILMDADQGKKENPVISSGLVSTFFVAPPGERWALGFDTPSLHGSSAGQYFSPHSVGHLGFTGTSFWMDRPRGVIVVLLTNRVHPWRFNDGIKAFRPRLHDMVMTELGHADV